MFFSSLLGLTFPCSACSILTGLLSFMVKFVLQMQLIMTPGVPISPAYVFSDHALFTLCFSFYENVISFACVWTIEFYLSLCTEALVEVEDNLKSSHHIKDHLSYSIKATSEWYRRKGGSLVVGEVSPYFPFVALRLPTKKSILNFHVLSPL